jgi:hypothetical protein
MNWCYICDQSSGKFVTILYQKVTMANIILWRYKLVFYDDSKKMMSAATSLLTSAPRQMQTSLTGDYDQYIGTSVTKSNRHTSQTPLIASSGS